MLVDPVLPLRVLLWLLYCVVVVVVCLAAEPIAPLGLNKVKLEHANST